MSRILKPSDPVNVYIPADHPLASALDNAYERGKNDQRAIYRHWLEISAMLVMVVDQLGMVKGLVLRGGGVSLKQALEIGHYTAKLGGLRAELASIEQTYNSGILSPVIGTIDRYLEAIRLCVLEDDNGQALRDEIERDHAARMISKAMRELDRRGRQPNDSTAILANLSQFHKNSGMTWNETAAVVIKQLSELADPTDEQTEARQMLERTIEDKRGKYLRQICRNYAKRRGG